MKRVVCWFSAGAASAVATKLVLAQRPGDDIKICRIHVPEEHDDNVRFANDCASWFGRPIETLRSLEYSSCEEVWAKRRYMSGPKGAPCTGEMKKAVRYEFEAEWRPDEHVFGFTVEERFRVSRLLASEPILSISTPLIDAGLNKEDCFAIIQRAGIRLPEMYHLGFPNANCIGCVKDQSPRGWNRVRRHFPEVFERRAKQSRELGARLVKLTSGSRERIFLDELSPDIDEDDGQPSWDCSILCGIAEQDIK